MRIVRRKAIVREQRGWPTTREDRKEHKQARLYPLELVYKGRREVWVWLERKKTLELRERASTNSSSELSLIYTASHGLQGREREREVQHYQHAGRAGRAGLTGLVTYSSRTYEGAKIWTTIPAPYNTLPFRFSVLYNRYSAACQAYQARLFGRRVESAGEVCFGNGGRGAK